MEIMRMYTRSINGKLVQTAKIKLLGIGKFSFETSLFGTKPYELNINMPLFNTKEEAHKWIISTGKWIEA